MNHEQCLFVMDSECNNNNNNVDDDNNNNNNIYSFNTSIIYFQHDNSTVLEFVQYYILMLKIGK
jgi:hypothetical protein